jgi:hypothetical protein
MLRQPRMPRQQLVAALMREDGRERGVRGVRVAVERPCIDRSEVAAAAGPLAVLSPTGLADDVAVFHAADESEGSREPAQPGSATRQLGVRDRGGRARRHAAIVARPTNDGEDLWAASDQVWTRFRPAEAHKTVAEAHKRVGRRSKSTADPVSPSFDSAVAAGRRGLYNGRAGDATSRGRLNGGELRRRPDITAKKSL